MNLEYTIRPAKIEDSESLSKIRLQIDGETENLDREKGEGFMDSEEFKELIAYDTISENNLFLVATINKEIVGFSRCEGNNLKRMKHKVEFGVCVLKDYWGFKIGKNLLSKSIEWAKSNNIKKISLKVLETNKKAIEVYKSFGFEVEGILIYDKFLSDGNYYSTIMMGKIL